MSSYAIKTIGLTRRFGDRTVVKDLSLRVPFGGVYGLIGPNGAGKTTTIQMLLSLIRPSSGTIEVLGENLSTNAAGILQHIGSLVEAPSLYYEMTGEENLQFYTILFGLPESRIQEVLDIVGLSKSGREKAGNYSLGMKQRLGLALALLNQPKILLLDEPTNGIDPIGMGAIRELMRTLSREQGITILVSSHLLHELEQVADHIGILVDGSLRFQGAMSDLQKKGISLEEIFMTTVEKRSWN